MRESVVPNSQSKSLDMFYCVCSTQADSFRKGVSSPQMGGSPRISGPEIQRCEHVPWENTVPWELFGNDFE